ncbi:MAG: HEAT repeat domain-containing protein [Verrucomicrobiota bacterium]
MATVLAAMLLPVCLPAAQPPVRVLILTGQNNHDWKQTTPKLKGILVACGRFEVDITETPEATDGATFSKYDVLLSNWNAFGTGQKTDWPPKMREDLLNFVRRGGGFLVVHAGGSSYEEWTEFQTLIGGTWGKGTGHGPQHEFEVKFTDSEHPITRGLQPFRTTDELWHRIATQPNKHVLATAFSALDKKGSGADEIMAMVMDFGQGRCFNLVLGHNVTAMEAPGFQALLQRGTEWAATGKVTIRGGPEPLSDEGLAALLKTVANYHFGDSRAPLAALAKQVDLAAENEDARGKIAAALARRLSGEASSEAKPFICEQLSLVGTAAEVPVLAGLIKDTNLNYHARFALERIPAPAATEALIKALAAANDTVRIGLIHSLAARRAASAIAVIEPFCANPDSTTARAAMAALGKIGTVEGARALQRLIKTVQPGLKQDLAAAMLQCGQNLAAIGNVHEAAVLFEQLTAPDQPAQTRLTAFPLYVGFSGEAGTAKIMPTLLGQDAVLQKAALRALQAMRSPALLKSAMAALEKLPAPVQEQLIIVCGIAGDASLVEVVSQATGNSDPGVRQAAIQTLGLIGNASALPCLTKIAVDTTGDEQKTAMEAMSRLRGAGVDDGLAKTLREAQQPAVRSLLIRVMAVRGTQSAVPVLLALAATPDKPVRREAITAIGKIGDTSAFNSLVALLEKVDAGERATVENALASLATRLGGVPLVSGALDKASAATGSSLIQVLGQIGTAPALDAIRGHLLSKSPEIQLAVVRTMADWPDAAPLKDLQSMTNSPDEKICALAQRAIARMAPQPVGTPSAAPGKTIPSLNLALGATATSPDGLQADGASGGDKAAIDGDPKTYWDKTDNQKLYRLRVELKQPAPVGYLRIMGYRQHNYAPKDFEVLCDDKIVKTITNAQYLNNWYTVEFPSVTCRVVELKITGSHGLSPAVRELEIYSKP